MRVKKFHTFISPVLSVSIGIFVGSCVIVEVSGGIGPCGPASPWGIIWLVSRQSQFSDTSVKKLHLILIIEVVLGLLCWHAERMGMDREVMFDPARRDFYDLLSRHSFNAIVALPLAAAGFFLLPRIRRFAVLRLPLRIGLMASLGVAIYLTVWLVLNSEVMQLRPPG